MPACFPACPIPHQEFSPFTYLHLFTCGSVIPPPAYHTCVLLPVPCLPMRPALPVRFPHPTGLPPFTVNLPCLACPHTPHLPHSPTCHLFYLPFCLTLYVCLLCRFSPCPLPDFGPFPIHLPTFCLFFPCSLPHSFLLSLILLPSCLAICQQWTTPPHIAWVYLPTTIVPFLPHRRGTPSLLPLLPAVPLVTSYRRTSLPCPCPCPHPRVALLLPCLLPGPLVRLALALCWDLTWTFTRMPIVLPDLVFPTCPAPSCPYSVGLEGGSGGSFVVPHACLPHALVQFTPTPF